MSKDMKFWWGFSEEKAYETKTATFTNPKLGVYKSRALGLPVHKMLYVGRQMFVNPQYETCSISSF